MISLIRGDIMIGEYEITRDGRIISHKKATPKELKPYLDRDGYKRVTLILNGKPKHYSVHRLVATTYLINEGNKPEVNHIAGNKLNNDLSNLEWVTRSENTKKAYDNKQLVALGKPKLTPELVKEIRENKENLNREQLARKYNVSCGCIQHIRRGRTWKNI